jgi:hypothetical protein
MYLKMAHKTPSGEYEYELVEGTSFRWRVATEWPESYRLVFARGESDTFRVVDVYEKGKHRETLVLFDAKCYIINEQGKTIDGFRT